jgi:hypothetical protein
MEDLPDCLITFNCFAKLYFVKLCWELVGLLVWLVFVFLDKSLIVFNVFLMCFCFSKAGDGTVDVQLIADLHKSEVFAVARELKGKCGVFCLFVCLFVFFFSFSAQQYPCCSSYCRFVGRFV